MRFLTRYLIIVSKQTPLIFLLASKVVSTIDLKIANCVYYSTHN
ncbi:hypothetical protein THERMOT_913 [Bathymodiolus thermophilus thioautotrophic gill symbiont]|nr:hypothetical protein THERMOT_913 [Bathymodiolus thermophilus thioautotrophic gill symbiont]